MQTDSECVQHFDQHESHYGPRHGPHHGSRHGSHHESDLTSCSSTNNKVHGSSESISNKKGNHAYKQNINDIPSRQDRRKGKNRNKRNNRPKNNTTSFQIPLPKNKRKDGTWEFETINVVVNTPETDDKDFNMNLSFDIGNNNISTSFRMNEDDFGFTINSEDKTEINDEYNSDLNIIDMHRKITKILNGDQDMTINKYQDALDNEIAKMNMPQNWKEKDNGKIKIISLMKQISELNNNKKYEEYLSGAIPILKEYTKHMNNKVYVPFFSLEDEPVSNDSNIKMNLIDKYLDLASNYAKLNITKQFQNISRNICTMCKYDLDEGVLVYNNTSTVCPKCQIEIPTFANHIDFDSSESDSCKSSKVYEEKGNFTKKLNHFIGLEPNRPNTINTPNTYPSNYEEILDDYFASRSLPLGKEIRYMEYNEDGRTKGETSKDIMFAALKYKNMTQLYKHVEWLCYVYWGWKRRNIDEYRSQILRDYDMSQDIIDKYRGTRSNLNRDYRLYRHLEKLNYPHLDKSDFRLIKTKDSIEYHENIWIEYVVKELRWDKSPHNYTPVPLESIE